MKVLVVVPQPFFSPRGTPFSVYYRTLVMAEQGARMDLLTYGEGQDAEIAGVRIVRIPRLGFLGPIPVGPSWQKAVADVFMVLWTLGLLLRQRYDVVHAHEESVFWCRFLKPIFRFRLIYDAHSSLPQQLGNFEFTRSSLLVRLFRMLEDSCFRAADAVITICPDLRDYADQAGVDPARHLMIENSIFDDVRLRDPSARRDLKSGSGEPERSEVKAPDLERPTVLYAGTFEPYQGIDVLVRAFALVHRQHPEAQLLLLGGTPEQGREMRALADSLELGAACVLTGRVSKREAVRCTRSARVLVSSRVQGTNTPLKIYEQLASGVPLVATRIWSHTQVLDESVCFLVDVDPVAMAEGILRALEDPGEAELRALNARALYDKEYSRPVYERKIARLLELVG